MLDIIIGNDAARIAILLALFAIVVVGAFVLINATARRASTRSSLSALAARDPREGAIDQASSLRQKTNQTAWSRLAEMVERTGLDLTDTKDERLRQKLIEAGYTHPSAPRVFTLVRLGMMIIVPVLYILFAFNFAAEPPGFLQIYIVGSVMGLLGLYLPNLIVQAKADRRREAIVNGFPDCLDLMLVCVEAGLGIEAAMDRVGREMVTSHPLVSQLLSVAVLRLRAGASREEAFRKMADLAHVDEIRSFTTLLIQSDKLGTSVASTLRVYASEMREKRRMRAEEKAHRLPVLLSIPLVGLMLPTMIGVLMLPASIRVVRDIFPLMTGG